MLSDAGDQRVGVPVGVRNRKRVSVPVVHLQGTAGWHGVQLRVVPSGPQDAAGRAEHVPERGTAVDRRRADDRQLLRKLLRK